MSWTMLINNNGLFEKMIGVINIYGIVILMFTCSILPDEVIEKRVIWKFGDEDIVRVIVNDKGSATILAVANGTIHVTVTTTDVTCRHLVI